MIKEDYLSYSSVFVNILSDFNTDVLINTNSALRSNFLSSSNSATDFQHEMTVWIKVTTFFKQRVSIIL